MHAAANAMPMPGPAPSLGSKWIKANVLAAIVFTLTGLVGVASDTMLIVGRSPTVTTLWIAGAIGFSVVVVSFTAYAALTGAVLSAKLPAFSRRAWIALHGAIGAVIGAGVVAAYLDRAPLSTESVVAPAGHLDVEVEHVVELLPDPTRATARAGGGLRVHDEQTTLWRRFQVAHRRSVARDTVGV